MINVAEVEFKYPGSEFELRVNAFRVEAGESVAIVGPSGSGKSTLLHLLAGIISPDAGSIEVANQSLKELSDSAKSAFRIANIGLVFQEFELISYLNVTQNILLPYRLSSSLKLNAEVKGKAASLASQTGIDHRLNSFPSTLSQGEKQRVAICRAMLSSPSVILADEPTGNLDPSAKQKVVDLLLEQAKRTNASLIMVTHDEGVAEQFSRVVNINEI